MNNVLGTANIAGVASGLNFNSIVSQLMAVEQQQVTQLQNQQTKQQNIQSALSTLSGDMTGLRTQAQSLSDPTTFLAYASSLTSNTTTDPNTLLKITPGSTAAPGTHTIKVGQLAKAEKVGSGSAVLDSTGTAVTSSSSALGLSGSFTITGQANSAQTVTVSSGDSLSSIVTKINQLNSGSNATGVTASILQVSSNDFRLVLTSDATGTANPIALSGTDLTAGSGTLSNLQMDPTGGSTLSTMQAAKDANITVDGVAVTRSSNTITDVLSGYTIDLLKSDTATTVTVNTAADKTAIEQKIQGFVDAYNKVMSFINGQMKFDAKTQSSGILASDSTVRSIQSQLSQKVLQAVPGLQSDRNSLPLIGVAPDQNGQLQIDKTKLDSFLNSDPTAVANVFAATGSSNNSALTFLTSGLNSASGSYAVNITQAATRASATGATNLSGGIAGADTITVTDSAGRKSTVNLTSGQTLSSIVSALNTDFNKTYTEQRRMGTGLTDTSTGSAATSSTTLANLGLGIKAGDTISISGTSRGGQAVNSTFTVLSPSSDTVGSLLTAIQSAYNQQVTATVDSSGRINITDNTSGDSQLTFNLTAHNEGGGTLNFGSQQVVTEGRYPMGLTAIASGNNLQIQSNYYGASNPFTVSESLSGGVGISGTFQGTNVAGTIGGLAANGAGQTLTGTAGNVDGMAISYTGSATGNVGTMTASLGIGAVYDGLIDTFNNPVSGMIQNDVNSSQSVYDSLQKQINDMQQQIKLKSDTLTKSFMQMEQLIGQMNSTNQWISQQFSSTAASQTGSNSSFR